MIWNCMHLALYYMPALFLYQRKISDHGAICHDLSNEPEAVRFGLCHSSAISWLGATCVSLLLVAFIAATSADTCLWWTVQIAVSETYAHTWMGSMCFNKVMQLPGVVPLRHRGPLHYIHLAVPHIQGTFSKICQYRARSRVSIYVVYIIKCIFILEW
jgi:hypothetical protein